MPLASARQRPGNQKENQAGHSSVVGAHGGGPDQREPGRRGNPPNPKPHRTPAPPTCDSSMAGCFLFGAGRRLPIRHGHGVGGFAIKFIRSFKPHRTPPRAGIPGFLGLARKIIRARAIKTRRFPPSKTKKNRSNWRSIAARAAGILLRKTPFFCTEKCPFFFFRVDALTRKK